MSDSLRPVSENCTLDRYTGDERTNHFSFGILRYSKMLRLAPTR